MRVYNFSPGPSALPLEVLQNAQSDFVEYADKGMSVAEMSHRSGMFMEIYHETVCLFRELMAIPEDYTVLFMAGGATGQFAAIPMNLLRGGADYIVTGQFAKAAAQEAKKYGKVRVAASSEAENYTHIPEITPDMLDDAADYLHITTNNTIYGTRYTRLPDSKAPIAADVSSHILAENMRVSDFGLLYAGAQKNIGPAGMAVVIVRNDLMGKAQALCPKIFDYKTMADNDSMVNTPPCFSIYMALLNLRWVKARGGVPAMEQMAIERSRLLYDYLDESKLFSSPVRPAFRSYMNIPFVTGSAEIDARFVQEAAKAALVNLKGHRSVGGMRASMYNAMPLDGARALVDFMKKFEAENGEYVRD